MDERERNQPKVQLPDPNERKFAITPNSLSGDEKKDWQPPTDWDDRIQRFLRGMN